MNLIPAINCDEKTEFSNIDSIDSGKSASAILGVLICGYIAERYGNGTIFFFCTIVSLISVVIAIVAFPNNIYLIDSTNGTKFNFFIVLKKSFNLSFFAVAILLYFSVEFIGGYKSYLFTLRADSLNISKIYITNIYAIVKVLTRATGKPIKNYLKKYEFWKVIICEMLIVSILLISFKINETMIWSIIVLIIITFITSHAGTIQSLIWDRQIVASNLDENEFASTEIIISKFYDIIMPSCISLLLLFGYTSACVMMGIITAICIILFAIFTYGTPVSKRK